MHSKEFSKILDQALAIKSEYLWIKKDSVQTANSQEGIVIHTEMPFEAMIRSDEASIFKKLNSELEFETDHGLTVKHSNGYFKLSVLNPIFFPGMNSIETLQSVTVEGDQLKYGLSCCVKTVSSDREFLNGVWFMDDTLFSANGVQLTWYPFDSGLYFLLGTDSVRVLNKVIGSEVHIDLGNAVRFTSGNVTYNTLVIDAKTPKKIVLPEPTGTWQLNIEELLETVKRCILFDNRIRFTFMKDTLSLFSQSEKGVIEESIVIEGDSETTLYMDPQGLLCLNTGVATVTQRGGLLFETNEKVYINPLANV